MPKLPPQTHRELVEALLELPNIAYRETWAALVRGWPDALVRQLRLGQDIGLVVEGLVTAAEGWEPGAANGAPGCADRERPRPRPRRRAGGRLETIRLAVGGRAGWAARPECGGRRAARSSSPGSATRCSWAAPTNWPN